MIRFLTRLIHPFLLTGWLAMSLMACSGPASKTPSGPTPEEKVREQVQLLRQRLGNLQAQASQIDQKLEEYRLAQDKQVKALIAQSQLLNSQIAALASELGGPGGPAQAEKAVQPPIAQAAPPTQAKAAPPAPTAPAKAGPAKKKTGGGPLLRLILVIIILAAIVIFAKFFMGRWGEVEDEVEEEEMSEEGAEEEISTPEGAIRISPEARKSSESPQTGERDGEEGKPKL